MSDVWLYVIIAILGGLVAAGVSQWIYQGLTKAGRDVDRLMHLEGQPEPCCAGNGQSMGKWVYCDLGVGHDGPHEGWVAMLGPDEPGVRYWNRALFGGRTKWTGFEDVPERADVDAEEEPA